MATYSQTNRPFRAVSTLGPDELLLLGFTGVEGMSMPYEFTLDLLSENPAVDGKALLKTAMHVEVDLPGGETRYFSGRVRRFMQLGRHEELTSYQVEIVPALWYLTIQRDCRIFQNKSVLDITKKILQEGGVTDFDVRCSGSYAAREYCVQYRETDFAFISRLLEEEGIFYFFEHADGGETLVLADTPSAIKPVPGAAKVRLMVQEGSYLEEDVITQFVAEHAVHTGEVTLRHYDPLQPSTQLEATVSGEGKLEHYDYPAKFTKMDDGNRYARLLLEQHESLREVVRGSGNVRALTPGFRFDLTGHYRREVNKAYALLRVHHRCSAGEFRSWEESELQYSNDFVAIPAKQVFRPPHVTPRPIVHGTQSAVVVGPGGEEIHVDKHGRVKVQFFWDREGKKDENSSCWVRVSSTWAGKGWGFIQIPRIGQEVLVDFLEGDPDMPIIVGRVYNAEQVPPYPLPGEQNSSGVLTRSTKGGAADNANALRFDDTKGKEMLEIHAEKDEQHDVENDRNRTVGHNESVEVDNNQSISVTKNRTREVGENESIDIGKNQNITVGVDQSLTVDGARTKSIKKDEITEVGGNRTENVGKDETIEISGNRRETVSKNEEINIKEKREITIGKDDLLTVGKKLGVRAADQISFTTGDASITMKKDGTITIKGKNITVEGSGKIQVKASSDLVMKGSKITQN